MQMGSKEPFEYRNGVFYYYGNPAACAEGDRVLLEEMFHKEDLLNFVRERTGMQVEVRSGVMKALCSQEGEPVTGMKVKSLGVKIWQLRQDAPFEKRFITLYGREDRGYGKPRREEYEAVYEGEVEKFDLEDVWERFARCVPADFQGHALSVSDIVELTDGEASRFFYVESDGFAEIEF